MESEDWRVGPGDERAPWTERSADPGPTPDLWGDDAERWLPTQRWSPRRAGEQGDPAPADPPGLPAAAPTSGAYPPVSHGSFGPYEPTTTAGGGYPVPGYPVAGFPAQAPAEPGYQTGGFPITPSSYPTTGNGAPAGAGGYATGGFGTGGFGTGGVGAGGFGGGGYEPAEARARHRSGTDEPPTPELPPEPPPPLKQALIFVAAWYAVPVVTYLIWFVALAGERRETGGRGFTSVMPWLLIAVLASMGLCAALRRVTVGWRAFGLSFAAAVIGAGLTTIVHSFAS